MSPVESLCNRLTGAVAHLQASGMPPQDIASTFLGVACQTMSEAIGRENTVQRLRMFADALAAGDDAMIGRN